MRGCRVWLAAAMLAACGAADAQKLDEGYGAKIKEYTTENYFLTELVDHLPASDTVPSPEKALGYVIGAPNKLTYTKDQHRYYRMLEKATPRVRVFVAPEKSEEGREQLLVAVSDEENLRHLDRYKQFNARLADPRKTSEEEARRIIREDKPIYWASGSIHSPETGSPEMLMELAYRLAVEDTPHIQAIRKNLIVLITPTLEVDGRDRMVDLYNWRKANPGKQAPSLLFWGKYVAHDNNRDGLGMALALSRNQMRTFLEYHPVVLHDLHESVPFLYTSTGTGPYNAWLDPLVIDEWHVLAYHEIEEMTKRGVPGVWTHGYYDGWAPNYMFYVANGHNAIGRFYETFGNSGADTIERTVGPQAQRDWFRPNPALPRVRWSMRNNVNMQQSAILLAMKYVADNHERFLENFWIKSKRSIAKAANEGPAAYAIVPENRPTEAADMVNLLRLMGVEVHKASGTGGQGGSEAIPVGSYIVRMDQPYSRMADMLLDRQYYNVNDPRPYDDTGWTVGALRNVKTVRLTDRAVLDAPMTLLTEDAKVAGHIEGSGAAGFIIENTAENNLATLRFALKDVKMQAAEASFKVSDRSFPAGSFILSGGDDVRKRLEVEVGSLGLTPHAVDKLPDVKMHELALPRIAVLHTWTNTQNDGWFRIELDRLKIPYSYISVHVLRDTPELRKKYDVIIFPPVGGTAQSIVNGLPKRGDPIPWKDSPITPNIGKSPDTTADIRGGIELRGMANLERFIEEGGLFVPITTNCSLPIDYGITSGVTIDQPKMLQAQGSIFNAAVADRTSPIAYGYADAFPLYFNSAPLLRVGGGGPGGGGGRGGEGAADAGRPSGRGGLDDPDIIQAMPQARPRAQRGATGDGPTQDEQRMFTGGGQAQAPRPRVVVRFAADEKNLLVSGELAGGAELAGKPAVLDVPVGKGHVVMFACNPMWRHETHGAFFLLFNACLNFDHLDAGSPAATPAGRGPRRRADEDGE